jgi:hypothetical protein
MKTEEMLRGEWNARVLRPVARWLTVTDETGRSRLVMRWTVTDFEAAPMRELLSKV